MKGQELLENRLFYESEAMSFGTSVLVLTVPLRINRGTHNLARCTVCVLRAQASDIRLCIS